MWVRKISGSALQSIEARLSLLEENGEYSGKFTGTFHGPSTGQALNKPFASNLEFEFNCKKANDPRNGLLAGPCPWTSDASGRSGYVKIFTALEGEIEIGFTVNGFRLGNANLEFAEVMRSERK